MKRTNPWTPEIVELMKKALAIGATAQNVADEIHAEFGIKLNRNQVIGKAHRLKLNFNHNRDGRYIIGDVRHGNKKEVTGTKIKDNDLFTKMWTDGVPVKQMCLQFGVTDKSIRRKVIALGLQKREGFKISGYRQMVKKKISKRIASHFLNSSPENTEGKIYNWTKFPNPNARGVPFMEVKFNECKFILGHGKTSDFLFCAAPVEEDSSVPYCNVCRQIVYTQKMPSTTVPSKWYR